MHQEEVEQTQPNSGSCLYEYEGHTLAVQALSDHAWAGQVQDTKTQEG